MNPIHEKCRLFTENRVVNWHEHVWCREDGSLNEELCENLVKDALRTSTDVVVCSSPLLAPYASPEDCRNSNDQMALAMKRHPGLIEGFAYVNPGYSREAVAEIERCVKEYGMIGVKLYHQYFIDNPAVRPVIEKCIELDIPLLVHASKLNYHPWEQPFVSNGVHFANAAKEYPEARFIMAHITGGGDWDWSLKAIQDYPNVYTDMSGSVIDARVIEKTVAMLGANRVLFGTDGSYVSCFAKMIAADIPEEDKVTILNNPDFARYLTRGNA